MTELIGKSAEELKSLVMELGEPAYRGNQIADWVYRRALPGMGGGANLSFAAMSDLPAALRAKLTADFNASPMKLTQEQRDRGDGTIKIVTATSDDLSIESVLMPDERRVSVCLSTQAGCPMGCVFCATGTQGLARNLTVAEIISQFLLLQSLSKRAITHVVFMGMGEPLLNFEHLLKSIRILHDEIGISMRHITVSTVGIVPVIRKLAEEDLPINLAISLHASNDILRARIVPHHKSLKELIDVARDYFRKTGREITFEYVLLGGVNDSPIQALELAELLGNFPSCTVNLIPYNATSVAEPFQRPDSLHIRQFRAVLERSRMRVTQRKERGHTIAAACGQLVTQPYKTRPGITPLALAHSDDSLAGAAA